MNSVVKGLWNCICPLTILQGCSRFLLFLQWFSNQGPAPCRAVPCCDTSPVTFLYNKRRKRIRPPRAVLRVVAITGRPCLHKARKSIRRSVFCRRHCPQIRKVRSHIMGTHFSYFSLASLNKEWIFSFSESFVKIIRLSSFSTVVLPSGTTAVAPR